jgi:putative ABC transport system permease protein
MLTMMGTVMGVGSLVAVLGVTSSANGQITQAFNALSATEVAVEQTSPQEGGRAEGVRLPKDADARVGVINGVETSTVRVEYFAPGGVNKYAPGTNVAAKPALVLGVSDGYWDTVDPRGLVGRTFDGYLSNLRVAVISRSVAKALHLPPIQHRPTIYIESVSFTVIGVFSSTTRDAPAKAKLLIPLAAAEVAFGAPKGAAPPGMIVVTRLGAAGTVARQIPIALDANHPDRFAASTLVEPTTIRDKVSNELSALFLILAAVCLLIGAVSITNTTLVAVLERVPEIGLRRSLGALPRHIAAQFLIESTTLGAFGGMIGTSLGVLACLAVAIERGWTAVVEPWTVLGAPPLGVAVGLAAGLYPSLKASRIEPTEALRR